MEKVLYVIREYGKVKTSTKEQANEIIKLGSKYGFVLKTRPAGNLWLVEEQKKERSI